MRTLIEERSNPANADGTIQIWLVNLEGSPPQYECDFTSRGKFYARIVGPTPEAVKAKIACHLAQTPDPQLIG